MKITFFSTQNFEKELFEQLNRQYHHQIHYHDYHLNPFTVSSIEPTDGVCCFVNDCLNTAVIDVLFQKGVKLIALRSAGYNHVDCKYAEQKGIKVCYVPSYSPEAVAEYAVALMLCLNRKIHRAYNRVREGNFSLNGLMGFNLKGKTVGIIGTGKIGVALARIIKGFGCEVLAFDEYPNEFCLNLGVQYVDLNTLLSNADIISLNCTLTHQTRHLINMESVRKLKHGVMLINTGRGALIETKAAIEGLKTGRIGYLGIDVYEEEGPLFFEDHSADIINDDLFCRLLTFPNVLITGHQGFFTQEAIARIAQTTLDNITHFENRKGEIFWVPLA